MELADGEVVNAIGEILTPDLVVDVLARVRELREPNSTAVDDMRARLSRELAATENQITNVTEAIAIGGDMRALVRRLQAAEGRRQTLNHQLAAVADGPIVPRIDCARRRRRRGAS